MIGGLIVTHGRLAHELLNAAQMIEGDLRGIEAVPLDWNEPVEQARERIRSALDRVDGGQGVIIFTDMFGGTPSNISLSFLETNRVEIVTGVNLPMIVKFGSLHETAEGVTEIACGIRERGCRAIKVASELLTEESHKAGVKS